MLVLMLARRKGHNDCDADYVGADADEFDETE